MQTRRRKTTAAHARGAPRRRLASLAQRPAIRIPVERILAERPWIAALVAAGGVPPSARDDVVQAVIMAAWMAVEEGRYRPDAAVDPRRALLGWLHSIVWRAVGHHRNRAWVRREIPVADPWSVQPEPPRDDELVVEARERLLAVRRALSRLTQPDKEMLALCAVGHGIRAIARTLGMPSSTAVRQVGRARRKLRLLLRR
ncbi:sigma-70 family RNA polymerase sigma factor [Sorangium sp. So ce1097]|uniref:sigma-70 family RNA polymerase sigma factor n=1 Tax=Sorangium sp. So ce1097 TaxID=3133330 RepID=UPI003F6390CC